MNKFIKLFLATLMVATFFTGCEDPSSVMKKAFTIKDGKLVRKGTKEAPFIAGAVVEIFYDQTATEIAKGIIGKENFNRDEVQRLVKLKDSVAKPNVDDVFSVVYLEETFYFQYDPSTVFGDGSEFDTKLTDQQKTQITDMFEKKGKYYVLKYEHTEKAKETTQELESAKTEVKKNQDALSDLIIEKTVVTAFLVEAKKNLDKITKDLEEARNKLTQSGSDNEALAAEIATKEAELKKALELVTTTQTKIEGLTTRIHELEADITLSNSRKTLSVGISKVQSTHTLIERKMREYLKVSNEKPEDTVDPDRKIMEGMLNKVNGFNVDNLSGEELETAISEVNGFNTKLSSLLEAYTDLVEETIEEEEEEEVLVFEFPEYIPTQEAQDLYDEVGSLTKEVADKGSKLMETIHYLDPNFDLKDSKSDYLYVQNKINKAQKAFADLKISEITTNKNHVSFLKNDLRYINGKQTEYDDLIVKVTEEIKRSFPNTANSIKADIVVLKESVSKLIEGVTDGEANTQAKGIQDGLDTLKNTIDVEGASIDRKEYHAIQSKINEWNTHIERYKRLLKNLEVKVGDAKNKVSSHNTQSDSL